MTHKCAYCKTVNRKFVIPTNVNYQVKEFVCSICRHWELVNTR